MSSPTPMIPDDVVIADLWMSIGLKLDKRSRQLKTKDPSKHLSISVSYGLPVYCSDIRHRMSSSGFRVVIGQDAQSDGPLAWPHSAITLLFMGKWDSGEYVY